MANITHKKGHRSVAVKGEHVEKQPDYMVQVSEPKMLRKDLLESIREIIIFMQGYETFRHVQDEKVMLFSRLKSQVKELNSLVDGKLRMYFPKGKLKGISVSAPLEMVEEKPARVVASTHAMSTPMVVPAPEQQAASELDELETQLQDIERQLQNLH